MAETDGTLALWAQATASGAAIPLGAFAGLIPEDVSSGDPLELVRRTDESVTVRVELRAEGKDDNLCSVTVCRFRLG